MHVNAYAESIPAIRKIKIIRKMKLYPAKQGFESVLLANFNNLTYGTWTRTSRNQRLKLIVSMRDIHLAHLWKFLVNEQKIGN